MTKQKIAKNRVNKGCQPNIRIIITQHNEQVLDRLSSADTDKPPCNCRNKRDCQLKVKSRAICVIYKASICIANGKTILHYRAVTRQILKLVITIISKALKFCPKEHRRELSKLVRCLKNEGYVPVIKLSIVCHILFFYVLTFYSYIAEPNDDESTNKTACRGVFNFN